MTPDVFVDGIDLDKLNYTIKVQYNGTIPTGGDSLNADLNIFYDVSPRSFGPSFSLCVQKLMELVRRVISLG